MNLTKENSQKIERLLHGLNPGRLHNSQPLNHYTQVISVLLWECKWILIHAWEILSNSSNSSNWTKIPSFWKNWTNPLRNQQRDTYRQNLVSQVKFYVPIWFGKNLTWEAEQCLTGTKQSSFYQINSKEAAEFVKYFCKKGVFEPVVSC